MNPNTHVIDVVTNNNIPIRAKLTVHVEQSVITFYDRRSDETPDGKQVGLDYPAYLIAEVEMGRGLPLLAPINPEAEKMYMDGPTLWMIRDWLNRQIDMGVWFD